MSATRTNKWWRWFMLFPSPPCRTHAPHLQSFTVLLFEKGQLNRHTRYRPATTTRNTATQRSCHSAVTWVTRHRGESGHKSQISTADRTHTDLSHTRDTRGHTDHTDEHHNHPNPPKLTSTKTPGGGAGKGEIKVEPEGRPSWGQAEQCLKLDGREPRGRRQVYCTPCLLTQVYCTLLLP